MNQETNNNGISLLQGPPNPATRPIKKVLRPLNTEEKAIKDENGPIVMDEATIVFRLKRDAEIEPLSILAIGGMNVPKLSKKHQAKNLQDLEADLNMLSLYESEDPAVIEKRKEDEKKKFMEALGLLNPEQNPNSFVLKRIDPSNILDFEKDEELFRKSYKTIYNDMNTKERRDSLLNNRRKNLLENQQEEEKKNKEAEKDQKYKVYDIHLKEEFKQNVLYCNDKPMIVTNFLEIASTKEEEEARERQENNEDEAYDYYLLSKAPYSEAAAARKVMLHPSAKGVFATHFASDEQNLVPDNMEEDSEAEINKIEDNFDSNDEDNPRNEYPDEEAERLAYESDNKAESDSQGYNDYDEEEEEEEYDNDEYEEEGDMEEEDSNRKRNQQSFKNNFWSKIKDFNNEEFEWPANKWN